jgi:hypothetical protein
MTVDAPNHVIPFSLQKIWRTKVHLYLIRSLKVDRSVLHARHVDPHKGVWQANTVVGEEERAGAEVIAAALAPVTVVLCPLTADPFSSVTSQPYSIIPSPSISKNVTPSIPSQTFFKVKHRPFVNSGMWKAYEVPHVFN